MSKKKLIIMVILIILILGILFLLTGGKRTDVFLVDYKVSEDGKTMTLRVGASSSAGFVRKMKRISKDMNYYLTFYSTFGINSTLGWKNTYEVELDSNVEAIYFYAGDRGNIKVLEKDKNTGEWIKKETANPIIDYTTK